MSENIRVEHRFKELQIITADNAQQLGMAVTAMVHSGWQIYGNPGCVAKGNGIEYFQPMICHEIVKIPIEAPVADGASLPVPVDAVETVRVDV